MSRPLATVLTVLMLALLMGCRTTEEERRQADALRELGLSYLHEGNTPGAIEMLLQAQELNPKDARVHHELGLAYFSRDLYPEAETEMLKAVELDPTLTEAHLNLGSLYIASGRYEDAIAQLEAVIADPMYRRPHRAYNNLGLAQFELGQIEEAERSYRKALKLAPGFCQAHYNMARLRDGEGAQEEALLQFRKAVELCPIDARYQLEYAALLVRMDRSGEARSYLERVSQADPDGELGQKAREYLQVIQ